jgi:hypothetical protein
MFGKKKGAPIGNKNAQGGHHPGNGRSGFVANATGGLYGKSKTVDVLTYKASAVQGVGAGIVAMAGLSQITNQPMDPAIIAAGLGGGMTGNALRRKIAKAKGRTLNVLNWAGQPVNK